MLNIRKQLAVRSCFYSMSDLIFSLLFHTPRQAALIYNGHFHFSPFRCKNVSSAASPRPALCLRGWKLKYVPLYCPHKFQFCLNSLSLARERERERERATRERGSQRTWRREKNKQGDNFVDSSVCVCVSKWTSQDMQLTEATFLSYFSVVRPRKWLQPQCFQVTYWLLVIVTLFLCCEYKHQPFCFSQVSVEIIFSSCWYRRSTLQVIQLVVDSVWLSLISKAT